MTTRWVNWGRIRHARPTRTSRRCDRGVQLRSSGLTAVRSFDASTGEVTVESGMTLRQPYGRLTAYVAAHPRFPDVFEMRDRVDPHRRFANDHLRQALGR